MGLLDSMPQQGMPQAAPQMGGLLGAAPPQMPQAQGMQAPSQGGNPQQGLKLAMQLSQNPTQQTAKMIIQQLKQSGNPDAGKFEQLLSSAQGDPATLKQMADSVIKQLSGGQQ